MLASSVPTKFPIPFAENANGSFIRPIPQTTTTPGAASLDQGFPPVTFDQVGAGGIPPSGKDFNGLFNQISAWSQWQGAGGLVQYDSGFSATIGGYPQGAILAGASAGVVWLSLADNNTSDPDTGGANWAMLSDSVVWAGTFGGTANALTATASAGALAAGTQIWGLIASTNTGSATLNYNGGGAKTIKAAGANLGAGALIGGLVAGFTYDGTAFEVTSTQTITNAMLAAAPATTLKGNATAASAAPTDLAPSAVRAMAGMTLRGQLFGLTLSNDASTPASVLDVAAGEAANDATSPTLMVLASAFTKSLASTWTQGTGNGGLDTGTVANGSYHVFLIGKTDGSTDILFSASATAPTMPSGWTNKRRIGSIIRAAGSILAFIQDGDQFIYNTASPPTDYSGGNRGQSNLSVSVPSGIRVQVIEQVQVGFTSGTFGALTIYDGVNTNIGKSLTGAATVDVPLTQFTNTSAQVQMSASSNGSGISFVMNCLGWIDSLGR